MPELWYYARDDGPRSGPFSDRRLKDLADADLIRPTDTIWREGTAQGVLAGKVKNLFTAGVTIVTPAGIATPVTEVTTSLPDRLNVDSFEKDSHPSPSSEASPAAIVAATASVATDSESVAKVPAAEEAPAKSATEAPSRPRPVPIRRARATAGRGAEIVGQDGITVKFRKRCIVCHHQDTCWHTMPIVNGVTRVSFFCPKCRKSRTAEIHGSLN
jgi:hypothetical protein